MTARNDLLGQLPQDVQDQINDDGSSEDAVCDAAENYIMHLESEIASIKTKHRKKITKVNAENKRMLTVLTQFGEIVVSTSDLEADLDFKGDQGSENREFDHGGYCGRTDFANRLLFILNEKCEEVKVKKVEPEPEPDDDVNEILSAKLKELICNGVHSEKPEIDYCNDWFQLHTEIWWPDVYSMSSIEEIGLTYHGQNGDSYVFRRNYE